MQPSYVIPSEVEASRGGTSIVSRRDGKPGLDPESFEAQNDSAVYEMACSVVRGVFADAVPTLIRDSSLNSSHPRVAVPPNLFHLTRSYIDLKRATASNPALPLLRRYDA